jgi:periplasmic mercuric ion binding protein
MNRGNNASRWTMMGAMGAAAAASLCCILPAAAAGLGLAGFAASALFAAWRPYLLALTFALLAVGFYLTYRPRPSADGCEPESLCERPRFVRSSRTALWLITGLVIVLAAFPYYSGAVVRAFGRQPSALQPANLPATRTVLTIQGMDCTMCAALIEKNLTQIQGVRTAKVSFEKKVAVINYDPRVVAPEKFVKAIEKGGYKVTLVQSQGQD